MGHVPEDVLNNARDRGKIVHALTEAEDLGNLTINMCEDAIEAGYDAYLRAWQKFKRENNVTFDAFEERMYSPKYNYAGTIDRVGWLDGVRTIFEIKTGDFYPTYALQTAAYQQLWEETTGEHIIQRVSVLLNPNGQYTLKKYGRFKDDFAVFMACLTIMRWKAVMIPTARR